jgi:hypothetical protein
MKLPKNGLGAQRCPQNVQTVAVKIRDSFPNKNSKGPRNSRCPHIERNRRSWYCDVQLEYANVMSFLNWQPAHFSVSFSFSNPVAFFV